MDYGSIIWCYSYRLYYSTLPQSLLIVLFSIKDCYYLCLCLSYSKLKCHDGVAICVRWLPHETSKVVTCGWDGLVKLWD